MSTLTVLQLVLLQAARYDNCNSVTASLLQAARYDNSNSVTASVAA